GWLSGAVHWGGSLPGGLEYATGKAYSQYQATELWKFETNVESGDSEYFVLPWNNWYQGVRDCNLAIKMLPNVTAMSNDDISKNLGEVRTLRAFYYFSLVRHYGDVIYNTSILTDIGEASRERVSLVSIYDKMLFDMRRTRKALVDGSGKFNALVDFVGHQPTSFNYQFSAKHLLAPISATEIDNNRKCQQNFGWAPQQVLGE
ncbi:unnamed protein product, partial [marine sediment metagenome]